MLTKIILLITLTHCVISDQLIKVVVLSRHNIRTPLVNLDAYSPRRWLEWNEVPGHLTTKGALLEESLGEYFAEYLIKQKLLTKVCPDDSVVHVYANIHQRTIKTAEHFIKGAFNECNVVVHFKANATADPVFHPVLLNTTESFRLIGHKEMQELLDASDLKDSYTRLNSILDIEKSDLCLLRGICDLTKWKDEIIFEYNKEPNVFGPLKVGNEVADGFLMAYYEGEPLSNFGWGLIQSDDWKLLAELTKENQNVRFGGVEIAKSVAKPLLSYMKQVFMEKKQKVTLLFGHDSNIKSLLTSLSVKPYDLEGQNEKSPIASKVVFEKWYNGLEYYVKIRYLYLSSEQIRNGSRISKDNPMRVINLELDGVNVNKDGYCSFKQFIHILNELS